MKRQPQQQQSPLQELGINMDPMAQLSGLVNLINASQAPGIQQGQFQQEMGFRQMMGDRGYEHDQAQWDQHQQEVQQGQMNSDRMFGLQQEQNRQQAEYQQGQLGNRMQVAQMAQTDRRQQAMMDLLQLFMHAGEQETGPGMVNMDIGNQLGQTMGFPQLFNTPGQGAAISGPSDNKDLSTGAINAAKLKYTGR